MNRTLLNADVLLLVFALANEQTQLALLSACKWLYREGGKQFLKSTTVYIESEGDLSSFLRFMDADGGSRMRFLRRLDIAGFEHSEKLPSKSVIRQFETMIKRLIPISRLTYLTIRDMDDLLSAHPPLCEAIAELTSIKEVEFTNMISRSSVKMLMSMRSKVETAYLDPGITPYDQSRNKEDMHAIMFLRQFSSSLRGLTIIGGNDSVDPQDGDLQYPLLSALTVEDPFYFITWHYVRAFPNLKNLTVTHVQDTIMRVVGILGFCEHRWRNMAKLRQHGCWKSLDFFRGPILMLWLLGLPCPISQLVLADDFGNVTRITTDMLRDVLGPARTTWLDICIHRLSLFLDEEFTRAFTETCAVTLKKLSLMLSEIRSDEHTEHGEESDLGDVLSGVRDMLRVCSVLESVTLCIEFSDARESPAETYAKEMDLDAACAALHQAVPSAKDVRFRLWNHRTRGTVEVEIESEGSDRK